MNLKEIANRIASKQYPSSPLTGSDEQYRLQRIKYLANNIESELKLLDLCGVTNPVCPLCDGKGKREFPNCTPPISQTCPACKGKG